MKYNSLGINVAGRFFAVLFLLLLGTVAGFGQTQQQVVFDLTGFTVQDGLSQSGSSASLLPPAFAYSYVISGTVHGTGNFATLIPAGTSLAEAVTILDPNGSPPFADNLQGTVVNPGGTLPFSILTNKTASGTLDNGNVTASATFNLGVDATGRANFSITGVSFIAFGFHDTGDTIVFDSGSVTTTAVLSPIAITGTTSSVTGSTAVLNASVNPNGDSATVTFEYGFNASYGMTTTGTIPLSLNATAVTGTLANLTPGRIYHYRVDATNSTAETTGSDETFMTAPAVITGSAPAAITGTATTVSSTSATLNGSVNPNGADTTVTFQYGLTNSYGFTTASQDIGSGTAAMPVNAPVGSLISGTIYHFQVTGSNSQGVTPGGDQTFMTSAAVVSSTSPAATTGSATGIGTSGATLNGSVNPNGADTTVTFQYGLTNSYGFTTASEDIGSGTAAVAVNAPVGSLLSGTLYHFQVTGSNSQGVTPGGDQTFMTSAAVVSSTSPAATTGSATSVGTSTATLNGIVNPNGADTTVTFQYGLTNGYGLTTASQDIGSGASDVAVNAPVGSLLSGTLYHFQVTGSNSQGVTPGGDQTFMTSAAVVSSTSPAATTGSATSVGTSTATLNGIVNPNGADTTVTFQYGLTSGYGLTTASQDIGSGTSDVAVNASVGSLLSGTLYHFQVTGSNSQGVTPGGDQTFMTSAVVAPTVTTSTATSIGTTTATVNGTVDPNGSSTMVYFEYGPTTNYGSTTTSVSLGGGSATVMTSAALTDLTDGSIYHFRAAGASTSGTTFGVDQMFTTNLLFADFAGGYQAAISGTSSATSGLVTITVSKKGSFTASVEFAGKTHRVSGKFQANGNASASLLGSTFRLVLANSNGDKSITGTVTGAMSFSFVAQAYVKEKMPALKYTVRLPAPADTSLPQGNGYGAMTVGKTGAIRVTGKLGDGTSFTASAALLTNGTWALYAPLYGKLGCIVGTMTFEETVNGDFDGPVNWFKPATSGSYTPGAFSTQVNLYGSAYNKPVSGQAVLTFTDGEVDFNAGDLTSPPTPALSNTVTLGSNNKITFATPPVDKLTMTISTSNGLFSGSFKDPATNATRKFNGAVFQGSLNLGTGVFKGGNEAGSVDFFAAP